MDHSPLDKLPPEVRNDIFELALAPGPNTFSQANLTLGGAALSRTCRQLRQETLLMYFRLNPHMKLHISPNTSPYRVVKGMVDRGLLGFLRSLEVRIERAFVRSRWTELEELCLPVARVLAWETGLNFDDVR